MPSETNIITFRRFQSLGLSNSAAAKIASSRTVMCVVTRSLFSLCLCSGGFEANGVDEIVESVDDALVELVELR